MIKIKNTYILYLLVLGVIILSLLLIILNNYQTIIEGLKIKIKKPKPIKIPKVISPERIVNQIAKPIEKTATQIQKEVTSQADKIAEEARRAADAAKKAAEEQANRAAEEARRAADAAKKAAEEQARRVAEEARRAAERAAEETRKAAERAAEEARKAAERAAEEARRLAEIANIEKILGQLFDAITSMGKAFTGIFSEIKNIGTDVITSTQRANRTFQEIPNIFDRKLIV
jgi:DNA repair exonuclease SbcCD ATPase subunit